MTTPHQLGYRWPAEWEPQRAVWLAWPHDRALWPVDLEPIWETFGDLIAELGSVQTVQLLVQNREVERHAARWIAERSARRGRRPKAAFVEVPTDDCWLRDSGPTFVNRRDPKTNAVEQGCVCWRFNGWGKFEPFVNDDRVPGNIAHHQRLPSWSPGVVLEGGAVDGNGAGVALTTEQCLLCDNRNPGLTKRDYERLLHDYLGVRQVVWLGRGLYNDHTDGHVDVVTRFVGPNRVATLATADRQAPSYEALADNLARLRAVRIDGKPLEIVELPLPDPVMFEGKMLAAGYANFVIANDLVVVPVYDCQEDDRALAILRDVFPDRRAIGLSAVQLLRGGGAFHCVTQQQPAW
jgi:agmatine deiminase